MRLITFPDTLKALLPSHIQSLCEAALIKRNERVFLAGTIPFWMYYVISGEVTLERSGLHGESVVLQRTRQGFVSEASLKVSRYHCDAIAIEDTHVIKVPVIAVKNKNVRTACACLIKRGSSGRTLLLFIWKGLVLLVCQPLG